MIKDSIFQASLVALGVEATSREEVLSTLAQMLHQQGYVEASYAAAVLERERSMPTGLPTAGVGVAIPHCDYHHVKQPAVAVGILRSPITFQVMGSPDESVAVQAVFMLALVHADDQIAMLQHLVGCIQNEEFLRRLPAAGTPAEVCALLAAAGGGAGN